MVAVNGGNFFKGYNQLLNFTVNVAGLKLDTKSSFLKKTICNYSA
jgi:hypothetical protein